MCALLKASKNNRYNVLLLELSPWYSLSGHVDIIVPTNISAG
jgi:hypothetical protein